MIIVDIFVPALDKVYDFSVDENSPAGLIVDEITEMLCQGEQYESMTGSDRMLLFSAEHKIAVRPDRTLSENGIKTGSRLILV